MNEAQTRARLVGIVLGIGLSLGGMCLLAEENADSTGCVHVRHYRLTTSIPDIPGRIEFDDTKCFTPIGNNEFTVQCDGTRGPNCSTNGLVTGRFTYEGVTKTFAIPVGNLCRCDNLHHPTCPCGDPSLCDGCDTTTYGQDEYWVRANFDLLRDFDTSVTNAGEIISRGYADWVDGRVGVGLTNGLYKLTATFTNAPSEAVRLEVGDYKVVVTNAGAFVFLLKKGTDYFFDTYPRSAEVCYSAQDDLMGAPLFAAPLRSGGNLPGAWTVDGGEKILTEPDGNDHGHVLQMPTLTATPDVTHLSPEDFPVTFTAVLTDCAATDDLSFHWSSDDANLHIQTPDVSSTEVSVSQIPDWRTFSLTVSAYLYGRTLESFIKHSHYGQEDSQPVYQNVLSLVVLTAEGNEIGWDSPVLDGENILVRVALSDPCESVSEFVADYSGAIVLRTYAIDENGEHMLGGGAVPLASGAVERHSSSEFDVRVQASWLRDCGIVSKGEDAWQEKVSLDMSAARSGLSQRTDSDTIDGLPGDLRGRVRGEGDESASVPEGVFNERYLKAAGFALLRAECGMRYSQRAPVQQQADRVYYSGHGSHASGKLMNKYGPPELSSFWEDVDVLVVAGCAVLDIKDYRASTFNLFGKRKWEKKGGACSPGVQWEDMGLDVYLGYAWYAPRDSEGGNGIAARYRANILAGQDCITAWKNANDCDEGRNACAIDCRTTPHTFWYWNESVFGGCIWTSVIKGGAGW